MKNTMSSPPAECQEGEFSGEVKGEEATDSEVHDAKIETLVERAEDDHEPVEKDAEDDGVEDHENKELCVENVEEKSDPHDVNLNNQLTLNFNMRLMRHLQNIDYLTERPYPSPFVHMKIEWKEVLGQVATSSDLKLLAKWVEKSVHLFQPVMLQLLRRIHLD
ncbi:hypothetical protein ONZ45_g14906 [Pleurotus djamor]|nr:hypothetical protein ONZ45_g14906 [Pleurotus djamor]